MRISLLVIGDEILLGQVVDTNASAMAKILYESGLHIQSKLTVSDVEHEIIKGLEFLSADSDVVLMTGGLGPTKDDVTKKSLAKFLSRPLVFSEEARLHLERFLRKRNRDIDALQLSQCYIPEGSTLLNNDLGTAQGIWVRLSNTTYISMPGVPYEMESILKNEVMPLFSKFPRQQKILHKSLLTGGLGETQIAARIEPLLSDMPQQLKLAYLPSIGKVRLRLTLQQSENDIDVALLDRYFGIIYKELEDVAIAEGNLSIEEMIGQVLKEAGLTLSTAESCTGGLIARKICLIPGASDYYRGSVVAYQNELKENLLEVEADILERDGAVSEACVIGMVSGACKHLQSDFSIACSGIAGPTGGSEDKPVGTVWMACGRENDIITKKYVFPWDRRRNIEATSVYALLLFWQYLNSRKIFQPHVS